MTYFIYAIHNHCCVSQSKTDDGVIANAIKEIYETRGYKVNTETEL